MHFFKKLIMALAFVAGATSAHAACDQATNAGIGAAIGHGHAFAKHGGEFVHGTVIDGLAFAPATIANADEFGAFVSGILDAPDNSKNLINNRRAAWVDVTGTVVIVNEHVDDCGTAFRPNAGIAYYNALN